jgi:hypothetical protein
MWKWLKGSGLLWGILSTFSGLVSEVIGFAKDWVIAQFTTTVEIDSDDTLYEMLTDWLVEHPSSKKSNRFEAYLEDEDEDSDDDDEDSDGTLFTGTYRKRELEARLDEEAEPEERPHPGVAMRPNRSSYHFVHNGTFILIRFVAEKIDNKRGGATYEHKIEVSAFGKRREAVHEFLTDVVSSRYRRKKKTTKIYVSYKSSWKRMMQKRMRPAESVILPAGMMEDLLHDAARFLASFAKYEERGTPHRRGYLFYGPPGTGKTSVIQALAGKLGLDMYLLRLSKDDMDDDTLEELVQNVPHNAILLIEDVDAAFTKRKKSNYLGRNLTFSGLLNVLDGVASAEGRILVMTTNHLERLDPALIRPGRVDRRFPITYADADQIGRMFLRFFPEATAEMAVEVGEAIAPLTVTMAQVQGFLCHFDEGADGVAAYEKRNEFKELVDAIGPDGADYVEPEEGEDEDGEGGGDWGVGMKADNGDGTDPECSEPDSDGDSGGWLGRSRSGRVRVVSRPPSRRRGAGRTATVAATGYGCDPAAEGSSRRRDIRRSPRF